jgi:hypothetical protein
MATSAKIEKVGSGSIEIERITVDVAADDKEAFMDDPRSFITKALETIGRKVRRLNIDLESLDEMATMVETDDSPITRLVLVEAHVIAPPEHASSHLTIEVTPRLKK